MRPTRVKYDLLWLSQIGTFRVMPLKTNPKTMIKFRPRIEESLKGKVKRV